MCGLCLSQLSGRSSQHPVQPHNADLSLASVSPCPTTTTTTHSPLPLIKQAVLRVVCQGAQAVGVPGFVSKTFLSFYAVLLCEVLAASPRVTEDLLTLLLPFLAAGLKGDASREYTSATLMVLTQLLTRAQLSQEFLQGEKDRKGGEGGFELLEGVVVLCCVRVVGCVLGWSVTLVE